MQTGAIEKFEVTISNPATRQFEGGSWHAKVVVNGVLNMHEVKLIRNVIDELDHSTVAPIEFVTLEDIKKISKRYTLTENCTQLADMVIGMGIMVYEELVPFRERIQSIVFWRDNADVEFIIDKEHLKNNKIKVVEHQD